MPKRPIRGETARHRMNRLKHRIRAQAFLEVEREFYKTFPWYRAQSGQATRDWLRHKIHVEENES